MAGQKNELSSNGNGGNRLGDLHDSVIERTHLFVEAFDAAVEQRTPEALERLREATDQMMRVGARILIELGRDP
jgi:hypothetical protein